jgi:hypothetical protein
LRKFAGIRFFSTARMEFMHATAPGLAATRALLNDNDVTSPASYGKTIKNLNANCLTKCSQKQGKIQSKTD